MWHWDGFSNHGFFKSLNFFSKQVSCITIFLQEDMPNNRQLLSHPFLKQLKNILLHPRKSKAWLFRQMKFATDCYFDSGVKRFVCFSFRVTNGLLKSVGNFFKRSKHSWNFISSIIFDQNLINTAFSLRKAFWYLLFIIMIPGLIGPYQVRVSG